MGSSFPNGWQLMPLEDCMAAIIDYRGKTPKKTSFGVPLVTAKIVKDGRIQPIQEYIAHEDYDDWMRRGLPQPGDVLMTTEAPLGEIAQLDDRKVALAQRLITLRGKKSLLDNNFLKFLMQSDFVQHQLAARATGTTVLGIKQSELRQISLVIPPMDEQKEIAHILGTLDDKIELNQEMNRTLEGIARALFKSWFIDFDPVRAKLDGRQPAGKVSETQTGGMPSGSGTFLDAETAALFPDSFEDSPLEKIPKGWEVGTIDEISHVSRGASPRPIHDYVGGEVPWLKIADATGARGSFIFETKETIKRDGVSKSVPVYPGDLILSNSATCGVPMFVELEGCIHDGWLLFRDLKTVSKGYLFHHLSVISERLIHLADGSVQKNLNTKLVGSQAIVLPSGAVLDCFNKINDSVLEKLRANILESRILESIRDSLLPNLLSGEICLKEAEQVLEEVT
jgi:type I restriction enzyme S subunit